MILYKRVIIYKPFDVILINLQDEGTFQMKTTARDVLKRLGSSKANDLNWRDMWAFVTIKGGHVFGEQVAKSPDFNSWGNPILLRAEVPLVPVQGEHSAN